ncbi:endonuclease/exonuclease/phosphatase family protein [Microbacterium rhizophilus]|uniref:endonuclease/exonuclease/phosphatase family protein n=1 Tax=Microbacterium rhizophilus TaxID=3138934 RepID=UPI0031EA0E21
MSWNVWWRFGGDWRARHRGQLRLLEEVRPDLVGIQECWGTAGGTQADAFAEVLGAHAAFVKVGLPPEPEPRETPDQEGVVMGLGLVSRWPIAEVVAAPMPSAGRDLSALVATVAHPLGAVRVVVGVTSWEPEREPETAAQVAELQRLVVAGADDRDPPSLLLADLNYDRSQAPLAALRLEDAWDAADAGADERTLSSTNRFAPPEAEAQYDRRIDHVLFRQGRAGARAANAFIVRSEPGGLPPSDHYPLVADIGWPAG